MNEAGDAYFRAGGAQEPEIDAAHPPKFTSIEDVPFVSLGSGLRFRPIFGTNVLVNYVYFEPNTVAPVHQHPEEQIGTSIEGEFEFELNGIKRIIRPGDYYVIPPNVPHGARSFDTACIALDIFSPPRTGFKELLEKVQNDQPTGKV